jgi:hypothetical protein
MVETGLNATLNLKVYPVEIPPRLPPELLVFRYNWLFLEANRSLCSEPFILVP